MGHERFLDELVTHLVGQFAAHGWSDFDADELRRVLARVLTAAELSKDEQRKARSDADAVSRASADNQKQADNATHTETVKRHSSR